MSKEKNSVRIVLTGGHAARTALSVVEELIRRSRKKHNWVIYWVGSKKAIEGTSAPTMESEILPKAGVKHVNIITGRVQLKFTLWTIPSLVKIPVGFIHALIILSKIKPDVVLSFGGYAAFPVVILAKLLGIPVILHEQTAAVGRANKLTSLFVDRIALARKESKTYFPRKRTFVVGNPIMTQIAEIQPKEVMEDPPVIYVTGGSRGSKVINSTVENILVKLLKDYYVIHQTGYLDYLHFQSVKKRLEKDLKKRYEVYSFIDPMQVDNVFKLADIIISRAGANTVSDIIASKRPSILIPIPFSYKKEQMKNAMFAKKFGIAEVLKQENLSPESFYKKIKYVHKSWKKMTNRVKKKLSPDIKASAKLVDFVEEVVS
jgi:UDP-N-acetylglucosamine--N-acetylmuramyl-(pentapeptide) pyrophosphoryl-undecaprenol N-acetylglucosamine transferase